HALLVLGVVAGVAVVAVLLMNVLGGGGGGDNVAQPATPIATGSPVLSPSISPTPTPRETLPPVVLAGSRNPFSIPPPLQSPSGSVGPSSTVTPSISPTETPTTPGGGQSEEIGAHTLVLLDVFGGGTKAQVEVDGKVYTVAEGQTFDGNFKLVSISGQCARFLYGDEPFSLCTNPQK
ncbi:MAG TPA: hypothetical protein VE646_08650, partial [Actinomycetota bacterium]|nr:hypothetical protein [Actinomycetota bacterium]